MNDDITVIKFGTNALFPDLTFREMLNKKSSESEFQSAARQIAEMRKRGGKVAVVTSGAIRMGKEFCEAKKIQGLDDTEFASIGARMLMDAWAGAFEWHDIWVGQILVTYANLNDPDERKSIIENIRKLLENGIVPIINENDPVSAEEVELLKKNIGDNDVLTSMLAPLIGAKRVLFLTDQPYVYKFEASETMPQPQKYLEIDCNDIPAHLMTAHVGEGSRGGIVSKVGAAAACAKLGMEVVIARFYASLDTITNFDQGRRVGTKMGSKTRLTQAQFVLV